MNHSDHVALLEGTPGLRERLGLPLRGTGGVWADLGAGSGAFTLALADLLGPAAQIFAVDRERGALRSLDAAVRKSFPMMRCEILAADFTHPLKLPALDGIVMANALHFITDAQKAPLLRRLKGHLRPGGQFLLVEYNTGRGNRWVPHPLTYLTWEKLTAQCGYTKTEHLFSRPSSFLGEIFSAVSL